MREASEASGSRPPPGRLVEVKRKLDGSEQRFELERWLVRRDLAVGRWLAETDNVFGLPAGSYSWGVWWVGRPIGVYRLHAPDGELLRYRIDVVEAVEIEEDTIRYRDLLLDARLAPDEEESAGFTLHFEDEDEVAAALAAGTLSREQRWRIDWVRGVLESRSSEVRGWVDAAIEEAIAGASAD
ncbi:MAG: putative RNA-binding protein, associated with RNAse of E/G family [Chloroflexi bacterium]|nr:MAG: putative RNA-binding protein, associated with RNAse of E/G family [Chloroflexota bacterium]